MVPFIGKDEGHMKEVGLLTGVGALGTCPPPECNWTPSVFRSSLKPAIESALESAGPRAS